MKFYTRIRSRAVSRYSLMSEFPLKMSEIILHSFNKKENQKMNNERNHEKNQSFNSFKIENKKRVKSLVNSNKSLTKRTILKYLKI